MDSDIKKPADNTSFDKWKADKMKAGKWLGGTEPDPKYSSKLKPVGK